MKNQQLFIANYKTQQQAKDAIKKLKKNGYDITKLSIIGAGCYTEQTVIESFDIYERMKKWSAIGFFLIGLCGLLFGLLFIFNLTASLPYYKIPIFYACVAVLLGATLPLIGIGFSKDKAIKYKTKLKDGKYTLFAQETNDKIETILKILDTNIPEEKLLGEKANQTPLRNKVFQLYK